MQYIYRNRSLVVLDGGVYVYKNENCKFDQPFLSFQAKIVFVGKSRVCEMTESSGAVNKDSDFEGNNLLLEVEYRKYVYVSGLGKLPNSKLVTKL